MSTYEEVLLRHEEVLHHVAQLAAICEGDPHATELLRQHLDALYSCLVEHFAAEEEGGYFSEIRQARPELDGRIDRLGAQHAQLIEQLEALSTKAAHAAEINLVREDVERLLNALRGHERAECALVQDATLQDLGVAD
jgi:hypothetical protein